MDYLLSNKTILVVEDNLEVRETIAQTLEYEGYEVFTAEDGQAAMSLLPGISPALILSDINMPYLTGIDLYKEIRKDSRWATIPFIFLTANANPQEIKAGRELGVEDYLVKPIDIDDLLGIIKTRISRSIEVKLAVVSDAYLDTVKVLANTIEGRDPYTRGHVERVSMYSRWIAEEIGWSPEQVHLLEFGARLHDIGKIIVPDHILKKDTPLTKTEWTIVEKHPMAGAKIVQGTSHLRDTLPYILYHHEKWNGSGYPCGLMEEDIPIEGRLMAIVDVYDALTTARPYHPPRPQDEVIRYLKINAGTLYDPTLVPIFLRTLKNRKQDPTKDSLHRQDLQTANRTSQNISNS